MAQSRLAVESAETALKYVLMEGLGGVDETLRLFVRLAATSTVNMNSVSVIFEELFGNRFRIAFAISRASVTLDWKGISIKTGIEKLFLRKSNEELYSDEWKLLVQHEKLVTDFLFNDKQISYVFDAGNKQMSIRQKLISLKFEDSIFTVVVLAALCHAVYVYDGDKDSFPYLGLLQKYRTYFETVTRFDSCLSIFPLPLNEFPNAKDFYIGEDPISECKHFFPRLPSISELIDLLSP